MGQYIVESVDCWAQVQGLMEIFKREWCNLYCWTSNGSAVYHVVRDQQYWGMCWDVLSEFWWCHVKGAERARNNGGDIEKFRCILPQKEAPEDPTLPD